MAPRSSCGAISNRCSSASAPRAEPSPAAGNAQRSAVTSSEFTPAEIESGRKLFAGEWRFAAAAGSLASLPPGRGLEVAFAGRSNVGKSSLINALTGRKALARTSHTPGRTRELVFFTGPAQLVLVDLPGYGYAAAAKSAIAAWTALIDAYLGGRANLGRIYLLVDARHGLKEADQGALATLDRAAVNYQLVLTKADAIAGSELAERTAQVAAQLTRHPAAFPDVLATSSRSARGIAELRAALARLLAERAPA